MIAEDRQEILQLVDEAVADGCEQRKACEVVGVSDRTVQRWRLLPVLEDQRRGPKSAPRNKLTAEERAKIVAVSTGTEFMDKSPRQIVPLLADSGEYVASEASFYRVLREEKLLAHRGRSKPKQMARPRALTATAPNQVYSWDITYLLSAIRGQYFYLYMYIDIFSRKIIGWEVHDRESAELSSALLVKICEEENIDKGQITSHSDNGGPMKGATMIVTMQSLGVMPSFSRPSVSNDNPFSESAFKTLKYCPQYPSKPFESIEAATTWVKEFVTWYNTQHLHSGICFVTPADRHEGKDEEILMKRKSVYEKAKQQHPNRWSKEIRKWEKVEIVKLNHLKEEVTSTKTKNRQLAS